MKKLSLLCLLLILATAVTAGELYVGTYNLRNNRNDDHTKGNGWNTRLPFAIAQIDFEQPDVFGTQELYRDQIDDILSLLPDYSFVGAARDDGKTEGEHSAIFYRNSTIEVLDHGDFWLSQTPDQPGLGWDAACPRICSWAHMRRKSDGYEFYFFNLHMDHVGVEARREGARLVIDRIHNIAKASPAILTGDFNVDQTDEIYTIFTAGGLIDSFDAAEKRFAPNGTFNAFDPTNHSDSRIDHVFLTPDFNVDRYAVLTNVYWTDIPSAESHRASDAPQEITFKHYTPRTPSDHYPVLVRLRTR